MEAQWSETKIYALDEFCRGVHAELKRRDAKKRRKKKRKKTPAAAEAVNSEVNDTQEPTDYSSGLQAGVAF